MNKHINNVNNLLIKIPTPVKIIMYVGISNILTQLSIDLSEMQSHNTYLVIILNIFFNIILWLISKINQEIIELKNERK